jgi:hypothetical protein
MAVAPAAIAAGIGGLTGILQAAFSGKRKKEKALEAHAANAPQYAGSSSFDKYFQRAYQESNTAAQQSALYKNQINAANRALAAGLGATTATGGGQGAISKLAQGYTDAAGRAITGAEQQKERRVAQFGQAAQAKSAEDMRKFQINKMQPWETKYNLLAARAAQAAQQQQAGLQNIIGSATNLATVLGGGKKTTDNTTTGSTPSATTGYEYDNRI